MKRHDAVSKTLAAELRQKRWKVSEKNRIITSEGLRKPDIICQRQNEVWVIDTQVVGFYKRLNELHKDDSKERSSLIASISLLGRYLIRAYGVIGHLKIF